MNLVLSRKILNAFVATTFGVAFFASLVNGEKRVILPMLALRRAAIFIWSDTPFVNFFSLIYIATVLHGQSTLRLQDYITFGGIAVPELVFMEARLAASSPEIQVRLMTQVVESEWVAVNSVSIAIGGTPANADTVESETRKRVSQPAIPYCAAQRHDSVLNSPKALGNALQGSCWLPFWLPTGLSWSSKLHCS